MCNTIEADGSINYPWDHQVGSRIKGSGHSTSLPGVIHGFIRRDGPATSFARRAVGWERQAMMQ